MKLLSFSRSCFYSLAMATLFLCAHSGYCATSAKVPGILKVSTSGKTLVVTVSVPKGWQSVTLESRERPDHGAWVPRAVTRARTLSGKITFRVPAALKGQDLRVRGEMKTVSPLSFFNGKRAFGGRPSSLWRSGLGSGDAYLLAGDGNPQTGAVLPGLPETSSRQVTESDIWKISGDRLYFFNQYRGLQVIDIRDPDEPVLLGTLSLPAVGEQMYVLDDHHVVLLVRDDTGEGQGEVLVTEVSTGTPSVVAKLPVAGTIVESRLVGTALYVASQRYLVTADTAASEWQWGTEIGSFDLSSPSAPVARPRLWFAGQGQAVMATDRYLFVATRDYADGASPAVRVIDISAADGTMLEKGHVATAGDVADKFHMNLAGEVFTAITETFDQSLTDPVNPSGTWLTTLETFSLADAAAPVPLGRLELAPGERLFATRFDGDRAYAVTFQRTDPLWIIDLSVPANPVIAGEIEVPGWSTYIHPLGKRLVTVGMESGRVAVSLFDVGDPASAALLSRVQLGGSYSWSEATYDEKALAVLADEGLILVPYDGFDTGGYTSRMQLIDLSDTALAARGIIDHRSQPRRAATHRGRVLSLSGKELLSVDIADRDRPRVTAVTELAWAVNRVFAQDGYLLELETPGLWDNGIGAAVRVVSKSQQNSVLNRIDLGFRAVVGSCQREGRLFLLQSPESAAYGGPIYATAGADPAAAASTNLLMTVLDVSALPEIRIMGKTEIAAGDTGASGYEAVWPASGLIVWVSTGSGYMFGPMMEGAVAGANPATAAATGVSSGVATGVATGLFWNPWWSMGGVQLLAVNVGDPSQPEFVSEHQVNPDSGWGFSAPFTAQGMIFFSHEQSAYVTAAASRWQVVSEWRVSEFLDVVDYADPAFPTARPSVSIPGQLAGLSLDGTMLYLLGPAFTRYGTLMSGDAEAVHACAYDGVGAYLVSSLPLSPTWPRPVRIDGTRVYLGRASADDKTASQVEAWGLNAAGFFVRQAVAALDQPVSVLACFGGVLAAQDETGAVTLFDTAVPSVLRPCGTGAAASGLWYDLSRAAGSIADGVWIPLDDFGLAVVPVN